MLTYHQITDSEKKIICGWNYPEDFAVYNLHPYEQMKQEKKGFFDPEREKNYYTFYEEKTLIGYTNITEGEHGICIGIGIEPELCGMRYGQKILNLVSSIVLQNYPQKSEYLEVRTWNRRAIRCYLRAGFQIEGPAFEKQTPDGSDFFYRMTRKTQIALEAAIQEELGDYVRIIEEANVFQQEQGFTEWTDEYPNIDTIRGDIGNQKGYALKINEKAAAYMCIDFDGEPAYLDIQGAWRAEGSYAVVHRMALNQKFRGQGLSSTMFRLIEKLCIERHADMIRIDTDPKNRRMQHVLEKNEFVFCGMVVFEGSRKLAYDKLLV